MYIKISQDGAGFLNYNSKYTGFFTDKVQTCVIYIIYGKDGFVLLHDTAQLTVRSISEFIKKVGKIKKVFYAINKELILKDGIDSHNERRKKIFNLIKFKNIVEKIDLPNGELLCDKNHNIVTDIPKIFDYKNMILLDPNEKERETINILNNLFIKFDEQCIPVDKQFDNENFGLLPILIKSKNQMESRAKLEHMKNDFDYINNLNNAIMMGVVK